MKTSRVEPKLYDNVYRVKELTKIWFAEIIIIHIIRVYICKYISYDDSIPIYMCTIYVNRDTFVICTLRTLYKYTVDCKSTYHTYKYIHLSTIVRYYQSFNRLPVLPGLFIYMLITVHKHSYPVCTYVSMVTTVIQYDYTFAMRSLVTVNILIKNNH